MKKNCSKTLRISAVACFLTAISGCSDVEIRHNDEHMIYVNESSLELFCGDRRQLTASPTESAFTWTSEEPDIAEVDNHGMVTAKTEGNTRIVVTSGEDKEYVEVSVKIPTAKSMQVHAGKNRVQFEMELDNESVEKVKVRCTDNRTTVEQLIGCKSGVFKFFYEGLEEGTHYFSVAYVDKLGNESEPVSVSANVYGNEFQSALRNRGIEAATRFGNGLVIHWKDIPGDCILKYKNESGADVEKEVPASESHTYLYDYASDLTYTSSAYPEPDAVDLFVAGPDRLDDYEDLRSILTSSEPCTINVFNFDLGGEGMAYHDESSWNEGGNSYRAQKGDENSEGVDLEGGGNIGYTTHGEWLMFTVDVQDAGKYAFDLERSVNNEGRDGYYSLEIDGTPLEHVLMPDDNDWGAYKWQHETYPENQPVISFTKGKHTVKFILGKDGDHGKFNFRNIRFTPTDD